MNFHKKNIKSLPNLQGFKNFEGLRNFILLFFTLHSSFLIAQNFDQLEYNYNANTNQLNYIKDAVGVSISSIDLDNQSIGNYTYNANGQLIADVTEGILKIEWTVAGKVKEVRIDDSTPLDGVADRTLQFTYDAMGNRVKKIETFLTTASSQLITYYVCNAMGELISIYKDEGSGARRIEVEIIDCSDNISPDLSVGATEFERKVGSKNYILNDHLNNVRVTISDIKEPKPGLTTFNSQLTTSSDYYGYGMLMPGRDFSSNSYRWGYQGKEKDDEIKGNGNSYDFGARLLDPRVGRWLSLDPSADQFPSESPYSAMGNTPIVKADPDGKAAKSVVFDQANHSVTISAEIYISGKGVDAYRNGRVPGQTVDDATLKSQGTSHLTEMIATSIENVYQIHSTGSQMIPLGNGGVSQVHGSTPYSYVVTPEIQATLKTKGIDVEVGVYSINMDVTIQEETAATKNLPNTNHIDVPWFDSNSKQRASGVEPGRSYVDKVGGNGGQWYLRTDPDPFWTWGHEFFHSLGGGDKYDDVNGTFVGWEGNMAAERSSWQAIPGSYTVVGSDLQLDVEAIDTYADDRNMKEVIDFNIKKGRNVSAK